MVTRPVKASSSLRWFLLSSLRRREQALMMLHQRIRRPWRPSKKTRYFGKSRDIVYKQVWLLIWKRFYFHREFSLTEKCLGPIVIPSIGSTNGRANPSGISSLKFLSKFEKNKKFSTLATDSPRHFRRPVPKVKSHHSLWKLPLRLSINRSGLKEATSGPHKVASWVIEYKLGKTTVPAGITYFPTLVSSLGHLVAAIMQCSCVIP